MSREWPGEVPRKRLLGNFRPSKYAKKPKKERARDRREGMSEAHLAAIRKLWCVITRTRNGKIDPHHLRGGPARLERGLGLKCTDRWTLPLSRLTHDRAEGAGARNEFQFFDDHGINPYELADALWKASPDVEQMGKILEAHQEQGRKLVERRNAAKRFRASVGVR